MEDTTSKYKIGNARNWRKVVRPFHRKMQHQTNQPKRSSHFQVRDGKPEKKTKECFLSVETNTNKDRRKLCNGSTIVGQIAHETSRVCSWQMLVVKSHHRAQNTSAQASNTDSSPPNTEQSTQKGALRPCRNSQRELLSNSLDLPIFVIQDSSSNICKENAPLGQLINPWESFTDGKPHVRKRIARSHQKVRSLYLKASLKTQG